MADSITVEEGKFNSCVLFIKTLLKFFIPLSFVVSLTIHPRAYLVCKTDFSSVFV
jgi:hypothetical protein